MRSGVLTKIVEENYIRIPDAKREYIGASAIGDECWRRIWYEFNNYDGDDFPLTLLRTFEIGRKLEGLVLDILERSNIKLERSSKNPQKFNFMDEKYPFFRGTCDAVMLEPHAILEIKTAKNDSFKVLVNYGLKKWSYKYFCQVQTYMGLSGIRKAFIVVINKDNSELWDEEVDFEEEVFEGLRQKANTIKEAKVEPPRVNASPFWYQCRTCKFRKECHGI